MTLNCSQQITISSSKGSPRCFKSEVTSAGKILPDGAILIEIIWNKRTHAPSPSSEQVKDFFLRHPDKSVHINLLEQKDIVMPAEDWRSLFKVYFEVFLEQLSRWRSVKFWAPYVPRECFVGRVYSKAYSLEHVVLAGPAAFDLAATSHMMSHCWVNCSSLKAFELMTTTRETVGSMLISPRYYLPLQNIVALQLRNKLSIFECSEILYRAPNMVECMFGNITGSNGYQLPIRCPALERLELMINVDDHESSKQVNFGSLFEAARAPQLRHLKMGNSNHWDDDHNSFMTFLKRSACTLEALELDRINITGPQLHGVLTLIPSLRILKVHGSPSQLPQPFTHKIMWQLTKSSKNGRPLCPRLQMFSINDTAVKDLPNEMIFQMLASRVDGLKMIWLRYKQSFAMHSFADLLGESRILGSHRIWKVIINDSAQAAREWDEMVRKCFHRGSI